MRSILMAGTARLIGNNAAVDVVTFMTGDALQFLETSEFGSGVLVPWQAA
jgi:hypothetical protein